MSATFSPTPASPERRPAGADASTIGPGAATAHYLAIIDLSVLPSVHQFEAVVITLVLQLSLADASAGAP